MKQLGLTNQQHLTNPVLNWETPVLVFWVSGIFFFIWVTLLLFCLMLYFDNILNYIFFYCGKSSLVKFNISGCLLFCICQGSISESSGGPERHVHLRAPRQNCDCGVWGKTNDRLLFWVYFCIFGVVWLSAATLKSNLSSSLHNACVVLLWYLSGLCHTRRDCNLLHVSDLTVLFPLFLFLE